MTREMHPPEELLRFLQLLLLPLRVQKLLTYVCCACETGSRPYLAGANSNRRKTMERIVRNALGMAVALGASSLMFAVTLV